MPPDLAVVPLKRLWAGEMTSERILSEIRESCPGLILLGGGNGELLLHGLLVENYRLVYRDTEHRLFAHKSIAKKALYGQ